MVHKEFPLMMLLLPLLAPQYLLLAHAAPTTTTVSATTPENTKIALLEAEGRAETITLLNTIFRTQIEIFSRVKTKLAPQVQRAHDIDTYISRLNEAIATKDIEQKDQIWLDIFQQFSKSPMLLNKESETGVSDDEYKKLLMDSGLEKATKNLLADIAVYFWKMAKISGKVVGVSVDEYLQGRRDSMFNLLN